MPKKANIGETGESGEMDMSPMIDMVFLLLIFFVVNATAITVKKDKKIKMPEASNTGEMKSANGAIVINVYNDVKKETVGSFWGNDVGEALADEAAVTEYIRKLVDTFKDRYGQESLKLYIRGDQEAKFKHARTVMRISASLGVTNMTFGSLPIKKK